MELALKAAVALQTTYGYMRHQGATDTSMAHHQNPSIDSLTQSADLRLYVGVVHCLSRILIYICKIIVYDCRIVI